MIDFSSLIGPKSEIATYDLGALFASLDVQGTHTEPRKAQEEAMDELTARFEEKDLILKISTGAGKTTVGLLYLLGHMKLSKTPAVYLCPTIQLITQVLEEARKLGITAYEYPAGERHPNPECIRGDAILVCTYEKMFNAKSTFHRSDVGIIPCAIVLDDAHAGAELVRKQFTLSLQGDAYHALLNLLESSCQAYDRSSWKDVLDGDPTTLLEVPHWIWSDHAHAVHDLLRNFSDDESFRFVWPYLQNILPLCRCVLSGNGIEIAPEVLPTNHVKSYAQANHRLYMSATLADDSLLTREFGVDPEASASPILPPADRGLGERMVLAPSLVNPELDRDYCIQLCAALSANVNVVVLTSSSELAADWVANGAQFFSGETFSQGVSLLKNPKSGVKFAVFAQRYDGVDLPDDACRVLVIDGVPHGSSLIDKQDQQMALTPGGVRNRTIFRIEQGMGRPVRSHADYAVVLLVGQDLTSYVGRKEVLDAMTTDTRNQIKLSIFLAELIQKGNPSNPQAGILGAINQCLGRDTGWKEYYNQQVRNAVKNPANIDVAKIRLAWEEREAHILVMNNQAIDASPKLQQAITKSELGDDEKGIFLQRLSRITYQHNQAEAMKIQQAARKNCLAASLPIAMSFKPSVPGTKTIAEKVIAWMSQFATLNAAVIEAQRITNNLNLNAKHQVVEKAFLELGEALGADSTRPDNVYNQGPDNLWIWGDKVFVIEAKNENKSSLHKKDSGQLHDSMQWTRTNYPVHADKLLPITVARVRNADADANYPADTRVIDEECCQKLAQSFHNLLQTLAKNGPVFLVAQTVWEEMSKFGLTPDQFLNNYSKKIE